MPRLAILQRSGPFLHDSPSNACQSKVLALDPPRPNGAWMAFVVGRATAGVLLVLLSPVLCAVAVVVAVTMGRPVLFRQLRSGLHGRPFQIVKFRTMRSARYANEPDADRMASSGMFLRSSSLDELPSLWNILQGDMAFVGPRPLLEGYARFYDARQARRLDVRPGLTGWAQVNGRNALTWNEKFELDAWYVDNRSISLDLQILIKTAAVVIRRRGGAHQGHATMPLFAPGERG
jgi:lipopolysaccharide/colanic/teichoic acid biosynthesis glycosyltransferase